MMIGNGTREMISLILQYFGKVHIAILKHVCIELDRANFVRNPEAAFSTFL